MPPTRHGLRLRNRSASQQPYGILGSRRQKSLAEGLYGFNGILVLALATFLARVRCFGYM